MDERKKVDLPIQSSHLDANEVEQLDPKIMV